MFNRVFNITFFVLLESLTDTNVVIDFSPKTFSVCFLVYRKVEYLFICSVNVLTRILKTNNKSRTFDLLSYTCKEATIKKRCCEPVVNISIYFSKKKFLFSERNSCKC